MTFGWWSEMCRVCKGITGSNGWIATCRYSKSKWGFRIDSNCLYFVILISSHFSNRLYCVQSIYKYMCMWYLLFTSVFLIYEAARLQRNRSSSEPGGAIQPLNIVSVSGSFTSPRAHVRQDVHWARWQQCQGQQGSRFRQPDSTNNH